MYKKRMMLQLFDDGTGAGSGGQGGNAGTGNGGQGSAGGASGAHGTGTYTYEQLEEIASSRAEKSERAALANFFRSQGMTEDEVTQAIAKFKTDRAASQPNVTQLQQDLENSRNEVQQMKNEKFLSGKGVKADDLDYVTYKVSKMVDDKTTFEKAAEKFLKENPRFAGGGSYRIADSSTGNASNGSGGNMNVSLSDGKNSTEYSRQYVDEASERSDVVGYAPAIDYEFDRYTNDPVHEKIAAITDDEILGTEAQVDIVVVDLFEQKTSETTCTARKRTWSVIPDTEGDGTDALIYKGSFKAAGEITKGTATTTDGWKTCTFSAGAE